MLPTLRSLWGFKCRADRILETIGDDGLFSISKEASSTSSSTFSQVEDMELSAESREVSERGKDKRYCPSFGGGGGGGGGGMSLIAFINAAAVLEGDSAKASRTVRTISTGGGGR